MQSETVLHDRQRHEGQAASIGHSGGQRHGALQLRQLLQPRCKRHAAVAAVATGGGCRAYALNRLRLPPAAMVTAAI